MSSKEEIVERLIKRVRQVLNPDSSDIKTYLEGVMSKARSLGIDGIDSKSLREIECEIRSKEKANETRT